MSVSGVGFANAAIDIAKNESVLNKASSVFGMLFPYVGLEKKAVDTYIEEIENSDMTADAKVFAILNAKQAIKKIKNQDIIANIAVQNSKDGTDFSKNSGVREEWLDRFMDSAGFVSTEELQIVWGKILANEFERPGSTPPNMIRVLSEITPDMAKAFRVICSMMVRFVSLKENGDLGTGEDFLFVPYQKNEQKFVNAGIDFVILNELESLGILRFAPTTGYIARGSKNEKKIMCIGNQFDLIERYNNFELPIGDVILTSVGEVLMPITDCVEIEGYYDMVKSYLINKGVQFSNAHDLEIITENGVAKIVGMNLE